MSSLTLVPNRCKAVSWPFGLYFWQWSGTDVKKQQKKKPRKHGGLSGTSSDESLEEDSDKESDKDSDDSFKSVSSADEDDDFNPFKDESDDDDEEDGENLGYFKWKYLPSWCSYSRASRFLR